MDDSFFGFDTNLPVSSGPDIAAAISGIAGRTGVGKCPTHTFHSANKGASKATGGRKSRNV